MFKTKDLYELVDGIFCRVGKSPGPRRLSINRTGGRYPSELIASMSRKGDCWDNSPVKSFFASLKKESDLYATMNYHQKATKYLSTMLYFKTGNDLIPGWMAVVRKILKSNINP